MSGKSGDLSEGVKAYLDSINAGLIAEIHALRNVICDKDNRIDELSRKVIEVVQSNLELSCNLKNINNELADLKKKYEYLETKYEVLAVKVDDGEQYQRKQSLRIEGIEILPGETNKNLTSKVVSTLNGFGAKISDRDIFRLHRSGRKHK